MRYATLIETAATEPSRRVSKRVEVQASATRWRRVHRRARSEKGSRSADTGSSSSHLVTSVASALAET